MSEFNIYLKLGFEHIADINGYDHILFVLALTAIYQFEHWKKVLILVTAFTIGHSLTLALASLKIVFIDSTLIEFLIPVTILLTAISNYFYDPASRRSNSTSRANSRYVIALGFGMIHGLGFSNYLMSLLGKEESIIMQLFAFNIGLEIGQLLIVAFILTAAFIFHRILRMPQREWLLVISGAAGGLSLVMALERNIFW